MMFKVEELRLEGVKVLIPKRYEDQRGFFSELWNKKTLGEIGIHLDLVQENQSFSSKSPTIRGLHFQAPPFAQDKLVRCSRGGILDVAVDIRRGSRTYGEWITEEISFKNAKQLLIPVGFLHGFVTTEPNTEVIYTCSNYYEPGFEGAVRFDDPELNIDWQIDITDAIVSEKDLRACLFNELESPFKYEK